MKIEDLLNHAVDKNSFHNIHNYIDFCRNYLEFIATGLQARIVSQNENYYQFYQYRNDGHYNITRPINTNLMYDAATFETAYKQFLQSLEKLRDRELPEESL
ncbi:MAG: hypothetical protein EAZ76_03475 [Nostocales cyanobacterium]|nr:MAG: hypothetical protein EAZ87_15800 [Nostocales cyanobacterium]TAF19335.1 MAG: hypothetical protein EAZ76_03475 [Nostocales cyanobacterium]